MIPVRLTISSFLSYQEPVTIDFTPLRVACITGRNGAGKSTLLDAMTWALFGEARKTDDSIINDLAPNNTAKVDFEFEFEGASYLARRSKAKGKSTSAEFFIRSEDGTAWKPLTEKKVTDTNKRICSTLRMDFETFTNVSFFLQGKADQFTGKNASERKKILSTILNLDVWDIYKTKAADKRKAVEMQISQLSRLIRENEGELQDETKIREELKNVEADLEKARAELTAAEEQWKLAQTAAASFQSMRSILEQKKQTETHQFQRIQSLEREVINRKRELTVLQRRTDEEEPLKKKCASLRQLREEMEKLNAVSIEYSQLQSRAVRLSGTIRNTEKQLEFERDHLIRLRDGVEQKTSERDHLQARLEQLNGEMENLTEQISGIEQQEKERDRIREEEARLKADCRSLVSSGNEIKDKTSYLQSNQGGTCPTCGQEMDQAHCQKHIAELTQKLNELRLQYREKNSKAAELGEQLQSLNRNIAELGKLRSRHNGLTGEAAGTSQRIRLIGDSIEEWEKEKQPRLTEIERILRETDFCRAERDELKAVTERIDALGYDERAHEAVREQMKGLAGAEEAYQELLASLSRIEPLERDIREKTAQMQDEKSHLDKLAAERAEAEQEYQRIREQLPDIDRIEQNRNTAVRNARNLESRCGEARQKVRHLESARVNMQKYEKEATEKTRLAERYKTLEKAFGKDGIPAMLIEQAIPEIEDQANQLLQQLSDGAMSLKINTQGSYKSKKDEVKETLDILIEDAYGSREYEMFSGGEAFRINFSIRLALSRILAHRSGSRLQTLVIDEGFGSQDAEGRELLIDAISKIRHDFEKILIITHLNELKERFPSRIEVEKTDQGSRVEVIP